MKNTGRTSRRRFLKRAAFTVAAPFIITTPLRSGSRPPPSERLTVGFIGTGKRGHTLLRQIFGYPEVQVVAVCDVEASRRENARKLAGEHSGGKAGAVSRGASAHVDFREVLARKDIDAVVIATPDHWHAIPVVEAAKAGKDIYCEKPLSLTVREARVMADTVKAHGVIFQTGSQQRSECGGRFHRACELVRNGRIGKVLTVHVGVGGPSRECDLPEQPIPDGVDWDMWLGPAPYRGYHEVLCPRGVHDHYPRWRSYKDYSGGGMTDWGAHHFDIAQWGLGMDDSGPVEIHPPDGKERERLTYRYANGVTMFHGGADGVLFTGTDGKIEVNRGHLRITPENVAREEIGDDEVRLYKATSQMGNWLECVRTREKPICDAEIGCRSVTVCHLGNLALWHRRSLRWDPERYRIIGDEEANGWLDRPKRAPWKL